jgi:hypothetical protein
MVMSGSGYEDAAMVLGPELNAGEQLLWSGRPAQGWRLRPSDAFLIPFSLMWGGFAIFWECSVIATKAPLLFKLWGIPFVAVGIYIIFGRFYTDAKQRARTFYGVTTDRVLIVSGVRTRAVQSLSLRTLTDVSMTEKADGSGTIMLGPNFGLGNFQMMGPWPGAGRMVLPAFQMIDGVKEVYGIIREAQRGAG